jgi:hypothetical protein
VTELALRRALPHKTQCPLVTASDSTKRRRSLQKTAPLQGKTCQVTVSDRYSRFNCLSKIAYARREGLTLKTPISVTAPLFELPIEHPDGGYLPEWLASEIRAEHPHAYRTNATWTRCYKCQAIILTGLDDPCIAASAIVDPTPLSPLQELICSLEHRPTYRLHLAGTTGRIQYRDKYQPPAGTPGKPPIVPSHKCTHRFPGFVIPPERTRNEDTRPPF